ncbi:MAG: M23 family metallopeptidase [Peptostreptococcales bacterium]
MIELKNKPLENIEVTSEYGIRALGGLEFHPGIDYKAPLGAPIHAVDNGKVAVSKNDAEGYGLYVVIEHSNYCTLYAHMKALEVKVGQSIKAGQIIGHIGLTGMTTGAHLHFEIRDCLYDTMFWIKSLLKGRHAMCIDPKGLVEESAEPPLTKILEVRHKIYSSRIHELRGEPKDFGRKIVKKSNRSIEEPYCINDSFQWWEDAARTKPYPTSISIQDGIILRNEANHLRDFNAPQSVIWVDKNGNPGMKRVKYATELDYKNIQCAVGGVGLVNTLDKNFFYSPVTEGFKKGYNVNGVWKDFSDVLRVSNKTVIGYNTVNKKFYLLAVKNMSMTELLKLITDNSTGEAYHFAVMGDGGGSVFMNNADDMVVYGDGRYIYAILGFGLS